MIENVTSIYDDFMIRLKQRILHFLNENFVLNQNFPGRWRLDLYILNAEY